MNREATAMRRLLQIYINPLLEWADIAIYASIAILFFALAAIFGVYSVVTFIQHYSEGNFAQVVSDSITNLLLVLIILELIGTIRSNLTHGETSLKPFLYIGIISALRRILEIGANLRCPAPRARRFFATTLLNLASTERWFSPLPSPCTCSLGRTRRQTSQCRRTWIHR